MTEFPLLPRFDIEGAFFKENMKAAMSAYQKVITEPELNELLKVKYPKSGIFMIEKFKLWFNLNDGGDVLRMTELQSLFCLNDRLLLLLFEKGIRTYQFESYYDLLNFIMILEVDWVVGDHYVFMKPETISFITNTKNEFVEAHLNAGVAFKFKNIDVPGKMLSSIDEPVSLHANHKSFVYNIQYKARK